MSELLKMMIHFRIRIPFRTLKDPPNPIPNLQLLPKPKFFQALKMVDIPPNSRRPVCPSCSKPTSFCLCSRLQNPSLENSVGVIILQHSLERKHPLNSARIAKLGLKNVKIVTVSDVNFEARFTLRLQKPESDVRPRRNNFCSTHFEKWTTNNESPRRELEEIRAYANEPLERNSVLNDPNEGCSFRDSNSAIHRTQNQVENAEFVRNTGLLVSNRIKSELKEGGAVITATIGKYGVVNSFHHTLMELSSLQKLNIEEISTSPAIRASMEKGFIVKKLQKLQMNGSNELEESVEFEIEVPPNSVLLFPTDNAVCVDDLDVSNFNVENLIVLDGTWAKAKRMYKENPWLRLLPHVKLNLGKMSLYSEVRHQPQMGFLSTIESIVYALKAVGDCPKGVDNLLDVFESMIGDQRRCKDEKLNKH